MATGVVGTIGLLGRPDRLHDPSSHAGRCDVDRPPGRRITSRKPDDLRAFSDELLGRL